MIKCETIKEFTLEKFDELKNIQRKSVDTKGKLYVGDTFECDEEMVKYLTGNNSKKRIVIKVLEIIPEATIKYTNEEITPKAEIKIINEVKTEEAKTEKNAPKTKITRTNASKKKTSKK